MKSQLQNQPKSQILEKGYINVYSNLNPKERRQLEYKRKYKAENPNWDETQVYLANKFASLCPENAAVLDAGCGNGNYVIDENRRKISWAAGVDVDAESTKKNVCLDEIRVSSLENLPFESGSFDAVVSLWVLEHLENPAKVFDEVFRVLKPGGVFLFATPNSNYFPLKVFHMVRSGWINRFLNKHLFGREESDVFETYYRANTIRELRELVGDRFFVEELRLNSDVSYTSFGGLSYGLSKLVLGLPRWFSGFTFSHVVGVLRRV